ncbi:MAG: dephospho-CoA kinase [Methylophaga sp.]|nr:MAG: dephospho-CoA kinase [Methylophaga sp.]
MLKIGLTGGIASGKSTVCSLFADYNVPIIDADIIARQLVEPSNEAYSEIVHYFGKEILQNDNSLNRKKLRQRIFSDPAAKQTLETILHPKIRQQLILQSQQQHAAAAYIILAIPLLVESKMSDLVDRTLVIDVDPSLQLKRLQQRDEISSDLAHTIINAQCSPKRRLASADDVIDNNGNLAALSEQIKLLHQKYIKLSNGCQRSNSQGQ